MIYGDVDLFVERVKKDLKEREKELKEEFSRKKKALVIRYRNLLESEKKKIEAELDRVYERKRETMISKFRLLKLEEIERIKREIVDNLVEKVRAMVDKEKKKKTKLYSEIVEKWIKEAMKELGSNKAIAVLSKDDYYLRSKLNIKGISFEQSNNNYIGVVVYSESKDRSVDNRFDSIVEDKYHKLYDIVDSGVKWGK